MNAWSVAGQSLVAELDPELGEESVPHSEFAAACACAACADKARSYEDPGNPAPQSQSGGGHKQG